MRAKLLWVVMGGRTGGYLGGSGRVLPVAALFLAVLLLTGCAPKAPTNDLELSRFLKLKENQARALTLQSDSKMPAEVWSLFEYLQRDKWSESSNAFVRLQGRSGRSGAPIPPSPLQTVVDTITQAGQTLGLSQPKASALQDSPWHTLVDAYWAYFVSKTWRREPLDMVTHGIQTTIPAGAIFFGDSDVGRFAISRAMESQAPDKRFSVITQNQLADYSYWDYARFLCGTNITMPSSDDFNTVYSRYVAGAYGTGRVAVVAMNAEFSQLIYEQNPSRRIYIEASWFFPEWAYPRALPRGLVFEVSRWPVTQLKENALANDREFWSGVCKQLLGDEIRRETSVGELCEFVEKIYLRMDMTDFKGDRKYVSDRVAQDWFGMARQAAAALYQWRCVHGEQVEEKQRMLDESLFAYKQTLALCPMTSMDFAGLLSQIGRTNEATRILSVRERIAARR